MPAADVKSILPDGAPFNTTPLLSLIAHKTRYATALSSLSKNPDPLADNATDPPNARGTPALVIVPPADGIFFT